MAAEPFHLGAAADQRQSQNLIQTAEGFMGNKP